MHSLEDSGPVSLPLVDGLKPLDLGRPALVVDALHHAVSVEVGIESVAGRRRGVSGAFLDNEIAAEEFSVVQVVYGEEAVGGEAGLYGAVLEKDEKLFFVKFDLGLEQTSYNATHRQICMSSTV